VRARLLVRKMKRPAGPRSLLAAWTALAALPLFSVISAARAVGAPDESPWLKPRAALQMEFGIDSLQRKFYGPTFSFSWPVRRPGASRAFLDLSYLQRINGRLQGAIDFWLRAGLETRVSETVSVEVGINHLCRHLTSIFNPEVLNLNELIGRVRVRERGLTLGLGFGPFVGGSPGFREVVVVGFALSGVALPELSLESELKWVDFERLYYQAGVAVGLANGVEVFMRAAREYAFPPAAYLGVRFRSEESVSRPVDSLDVETGYYPYYEKHKILVLGGFRLRLLEEPRRRFFVDVDFRTPLLSGTSLFAQSWPDRMLYDIEAQYEKPMTGGLFAAWYVRYGVDMPIDKPLRFRSSLSTGLTLRNQRDFNRLEKSLRFEIAGGYDFTFDYDLRIRLGAQVRPRRLFPMGTEFRVDASSALRTVEFKVFAALGNDIEVRPFVGIRKISYLAGPSPPPDRLLNRLTTGVTLYKWF